VQTRVIRQVERLPVQVEDPQQYVNIHQHSLLTTEQLWTQIKQLGINGDLVCIYVYTYTYAYVIG
jgi:hypothetical protein